MHKWCSMRSEGAVGLIQDGEVCQVVDEEMFEGSVGCEEMPLQGWCRRMKEG